MFYLIISCWTAVNNEPAELHQRINGRKKNAALRCWKGLDGCFRTPTGARWGDSVKKRNVSRMLFQWNVASLFHKQSNNAGWLFAPPHRLFTSFLSGPKPFSWIHVQRGQNEHHGVYKERKSLSVCKCVNEWISHLPLEKSADVLWSSDKPLGRYF